MYRYVLDEALAPLTYYNNPSTGEMHRGFNGSK